MNSTVRNSDADCVKLCLEGHTDAFRHLVSKYEAAVIAFLVSRLSDRETAVLAAQDVMTRAYFSLAKLKNPDAFSSWLFGIADRVAKETKRSQRAMAARSNTDVLLEDIQDKSNSASGIVGELETALATLPDAYKEVILMRFYAGQSCIEIGRSLGVSLGTVTSRLSRAYTLLRSALQEQNQDSEIGR